MSRVRRSIAALRGFVRGFLGITAAPPHDPNAARRQIQEQAERRPHCC
jgi:hypothetical protein